MTRMLRSFAAACFFALPAAGCAMDPDLAGDEEEPSLEEENAVQLPLVTVDRQCVTRGPVLGDRVTICNSIQKEEGGKARAFAAMETANPGVHLQLDRVLLNSSSRGHLETTQLNNGRLRIESATRLRGPFGCNVVVGSHAFYSIRWRDGSLSSGDVEAVYLTCH